MADILPFRALRYDLQRVSAAQVVTQPYDKITPAMQERYYAASPYNLVRIILGRREPETTPATMSIPAPPPTAGSGGPRESSARIPRLRFTPIPRPSPPRRERSSSAADSSPSAASRTIPPKSSSGTSKLSPSRRPTASTCSAPPARTTNSFSCSMKIPERSIPCSPTPAAAPTIDVTDEYGVAHRVWQISDADVIASVQEKMRDKKLVIADGHHRYETALNFRNECRSTRPARSVQTPHAPYEFVMMTFVNMNDPGLLVLPTHRVVHSLESFSVRRVSELQPRLLRSRRRSILASTPPAPPPFCKNAAAPEPLCWPSPPTAPSSCTLRRPAGAQFFAGLSARQQALDVVQLHKCLLEGVLKLSEESIRNQQNLSYLRDASEASGPGSRRAKPPTSHS